jgi:hypothetical protein
MSYAPVILVLIVLAVVFVLVVNKATMLVIGVWLGTAVVGFAVMICVINVKERQAPGLAGVSKVAGITFIIT